MTEGILERIRSWPWRVIPRSSCHVILWSYWHQAWQGYLNIHPWQTALIHSLKWKSYSWCNESMKSQRVLIGFSSCYSVPSRYARYTSLHVNQKQQMNGSEGGQQRKDNPVSLLAIVSAMKQSWMCFLKGTHSLGTVMLNIVTSCVMCKTLIHSQADNL